MKCLSDLDSLFIQYHGQNSDVVPSRKASIPQEISLFWKENTPHILKGDFSFVEKYELNEKDIDLLHTYKTAHEILGPELCSMCETNPEYISLLIDSFTSYIERYETEKQILQTLDLIPYDRKNKRVINFVNIYHCSAQEKQILTDFFDNTEISFSSLDCKKLVNRLTEKDQIKAILRFLDWCCFDLRQIAHHSISVATNADKTNAASTRARSVLLGRALGGTLQELGEQEGITRERVRQIEAKAIRIFKTKNYHNMILRAFSALKNGDYVITSSELESYFEEEAVILLYLLKKCESAFYIYDFQSDTFILGSTSILDEVQDYVDGLPDLIKINELDTFISSAVEEGFNSQLLNQVFLNEYSLTGNVYHRTRLTLGRMYEIVLEKYYEDGIHIYDPVEIATFRNNVYSEFGDVNLTKSDRAIGSRIASIGILCGRGIYRSKKKEYISKQLVNKIREYILSSSSPVFLMNTLFSVFEDELRKEGVDNKYYLQGILHELFESDFFFKRDYLSKDKEVTSLYSEIVKYIKSADSLVSREEIKAAFPGLPDIVLSFAVSDPEILNMFGKYLHASKLNVTDEEISYLKKTLSVVLEDDKPHHIRDLCDTIMPTHSAILTRNYALHPFCAFSLLQYLLGDYFQFERPYIANEGVSIDHPSEVLHELLYSEDTYSISDIRAFSYENRFQINSVLEYVNTCNDKFFILDKDTIIDISLTGITETIVQQIEKMLLQEVFQTMLISNISCFYLLPPIKVSWTEWLLYSAIYKWGNLFEVGTTSNRIQNANPVIAPKGHLNISNDMIMADSQPVAKIDDLDDIDNLILEYLEYDFGDDPNEL